MSGAPPPERRLVMPDPETQDTGAAPEVTPDGTPAAPGGGVDDPRLGTLGEVGGEIDPGTIPGAGDGTATVTVAKDPDADEPDHLSEGPKEPSEADKTVLAALQGVVDRIGQLEVRDRPPEPEPAEPEAPDLTDVDFERLNTEDTVKLSVAATKRLIEGTETRLTAAFQKAIAGTEVRNSRAMHADFETLVEGPEGVRQLSTENPNWPVEKCYQMAKRLRGAPAPGAAPAPATAPRGTLDEGGTKPAGAAGGSDATTALDRKAARGELSGDQAIAYAFKTLGL